MIKWRICMGDMESDRTKAGGLSSSERKKRRLAALEAKRTGSKRHQGPHEPQTSQTKRVSKPLLKEGKAEVKDSSSVSAPVQGDDEQATQLYSTYDGTVALFPWMEDDKRTLQDVTRELLYTNPRCRRRNASGVVDKMKEKTLLLDNPDTKRSGKNRKMYLKSSGIRKASRKELKELGALNVNAMGLTYDDALILHTIWKEYRDSLLESTLSKKDLQERLYGMDRHGARVVFQKIENHSERTLVSGILVADTDSSIHVLDKAGRYHIALKNTVTYSIEINAEQRITIMPPDR